MYIRIVESSELRSELSLRASDYLNKEDQMNAMLNRLDTGKQLPKELLEPMEQTPIETSEVNLPKVAADQLWEIADGRRAHSPKMRCVQIISVGDTHALVENVETKHRTMVRLSAFNGRTKKSYKPVNGGS